MIAGVLLSLQCYKGKPSGDALGSAAGRGLTALLAASRRAQRLALEGGWAAQHLWCGVLSVRCCRVFAVMSFGSTCETHFQGR